MKSVTLVAKVNREKCRGCRICTKVCPVLAISVTDKKAVVNEEECRACANCEQRCPFHAIEMVKREEPLEIGVDVTKFDYGEIRKICEKAHLNPEQILCYCVGVRAEEVAAAILDGADTPEKVSSRTGIRTGCTIECIQPLLRLLDAAGYKLNPIEGGWQWYGKTATAWTVPESVKEKYSSRGFYFDEDERLLDEVVATHTDYESKGGKNHDE
ncbi:4Fe-4S dicluster domain-containing protein [Acidilutibacter cellobiosedens]|uniref:4Fe-4S dicluster domain-containing protein n=1 Tax=Acidilutibacter cellobiosedens TaxID=2507161 RepID=A0A410QAQ9_9FIRM|nr:4Fe-4S binding protein [Acidilutibacter cellobiosedens]QAT61102.1 4Fe-4S dicluster domain-containing protein [Acidilutibacter cellobiosedens]